MVELDTRLSCALYYFIIPGVVVYLVAYLFGVRTKLRHALHHFMHTYVTRWMHGTIFLKVKEILFQQMHDLREKSQTDLNVLEIGVGKGQNFKFYPKGTNLTCLDPHSHHHDADLKKNLEESGNNVKLVGFLQNFAEDMSDVKNDTFDAVVCTFVMCTVRDPAATLAEVRRVLKPGGSFFFLEHVAGQKGTFIRRLQNVLQFLWPSNVSKGNLNRETWSFLDQSGFSQVNYNHYTANTRLFFFIRPCIYGTAVK